jgi:hypothetical protein
VSDGSASTGLRDINRREIEPAIDAVAEAIPEGSD